MTDLIEHEPRPSTARRAGFIAVATAAAVAVGGVAYAATGSSTPTPAPQSSTAGPQGSTSQPAPGAPGALGRHMMREGGHGPGLGLGMRGDVLHGEFTVAKPGGGYQTIEVQRGDVTSVSKSAITVKSADGVSTTYTVTADTMVNAARDGISTVKTGHTVEILATVSGGTATAQHIRDTTLAKANRQRWLPQPPVGGDGRAGGGAGSGSGGQSSGSGT